MSDRLVMLSDDFWNIRGSFKINPLIDIGTHCSLVRLGNGRFVFLDSYAMSDDIRAEIDALTDGGTLVEAVINLHPFHTVHCEWMASAFPGAVMYGTERHKQHCSAVDWADEICESPAFAERYGDDFAFSIPRGMALVCADESVHFSSILALHRASGTIHVDDTLMYMETGFPLSLLPMDRRLDFHPTLAKALDPRPSAADDFREWAIELGTQWADARRLAAAHNAVLEMAEGTFPEHIGAALGRVQSTLERHRSAAA